jgi:membrane-associated phospholipid phosphatase
MFIIFILSGICKLSFIKAEVCLAVIFGTTFIMPALSLLVLKKIKAIETFTMEKREERFIPIFFVVVFLYITSRFFNGIHALALYNFYLICNLILCIIVFWINFWWKISMHAIGWGAFCATLLIMTEISLKIFFPYLIAGFILSGIVGSARLYLKSHSDSQIYAGFAVGFIIPLLIYIFIV